jgi:SAM-dependent methyltransferase
MEQQAYSLLESNESWWYRGRAWVIAVASSCAKVEKRDKVLDYGAGYGGMHDLLGRFGNEIFAFEPDDGARAMAAKRNYRAVYAREDEAFANRFDIVGLFDVVEHIEDDRAFLVRLRSILNDRGILIITVPAFQFLWSAHDVNLHHFRRYTRRQMRELLDETGYSVEFISYWNMSLFFPAAMMRILGRSGESGLSLPGIFDALLLGVIKIEAMIMRVVPLPFGTSLVAVARKRTELPNGK